MNPFDELSVFEDKRGRECRFVKVIKDRIMIWRKDERLDAYYCGKLDYSLVDEDILTKAGIWEDLPKKVRSEIIKAQEEKQQSIKEKMELAREKRKKRYDFSHLPDVMKCKCGTEIKPNYYYLQKKADKKGIPVDDLFKNFKCQKCESTRGRKKK